MLTFHIKAFPAGFQCRKKLKFDTIFQAQDLRNISWTTAPILGLFILIWMHFSCWIQIWQWKFEFWKFLEKNWKKCTVVCTSLQSVWRGLAWEQTEKPGKAFELYIIYSSNCVRIAKLRLAIDTPPVCKCIFMCLVLWNFNTETLKIVKCDLMSRNTQCLRMKRESSGWHIPVLPSNVNVPSPTRHVLAGGKTWVLNKMLSKYEFILFNKVCFTKNDKKAKWWM